MELFAGAIGVLYCLFWIRDLLREGYQWHERDLRHLFLVKLFMIGIILFLSLLAVLPAHAATTDDLYRYMNIPNGQIEQSVADNGEFQTSGPYKINVPDDKTFEVNIEGARLTWRDDGINEDTFPILQSDYGTREAYLFGKAGMVTFEMAQNEMGSRLCRPATLQEALAFVTKYPQRPGTEFIVMGQKWTGRGGFWFARYRVSSSGGSLDLVKVEPGKPWCDVQFLAVRDWRRPE